MPTTFSADDRLTLLRFAAFFFWLEGAPDDCEVDALAAMGEALGLDGFAPEVSELFLAPPPAALVDPARVPRRLVRPLLELALVAASVRPTAERHAAFADLVAIATSRRRAPRWAVDAAA